MGRQHPAPLDNAALTRSSCQPPQALEAKPGAAIFHLELLLDDARKRAITEHLMGDAHSRRP